MSIKQNTIIEVLEFPESQNGYLMLESRRKQTNPLLLNMKIGFCLLPDDRPERKVTTKMSFFEIQPERSAKIYLVTPGPEKKEYPNK